MKNRQLPTQHILRSVGRAMIGAGRPAAALLLMSILAIPACETDSYFDPSRTGYFERVPTTIPILTRIDTIERIPDPLGVTGPPESLDLVVVPSQYVLGEGDVVKTDVFELVSQNQTETAVRSIDQAGNIRLPLLGDIRAAGLTVAQYEETVVERAKRLLPKPLVNVSVEEGRSFIYVIGGAVEQPGEFKLPRPDFRLRNVLSVSGGAAPTTERVLVVRGAGSPKSDSVAGQVQPAGAGIPGSGNTNGTAGGSDPTSGAGSQAVEPVKPVSIDDLINQLDQPSGGQHPAGAQAPAGQQTPSGGPTGVSAPEATNLIPPTLEPDPPSDSPVAPGAVRTPRKNGLVQGGSAAPVDIDTLEPVSVSDSSGLQGASRSAAQMGERAGSEDDGGFIFDVNKQQWIRLGTSASGATQGTGSAHSEGTSSARAQQGTGAQTAGSNDQGKPTVAAPLDLAGAMAQSTRIIEIDYIRLMSGDASQNVVIRNGDWVYVEPDTVGNIYVGGEVARPGVFNMPPTGKVTLSRMVDAAGGLSQLAIPERVDLVRVVGVDREACIRVNLAAIRNRAEPDIVMKPDDHIIIGTNFWATPLAVFRNGFRMTYGFGFLLDRNWGNDVFGAPPSNFTGG